MEIRPHPGHCLACPPRTRARSYMRTPPRRSPPCPRGDRTDPRPITLTRARGVRAPVRAVTGASTKRAVSSCAQDPGGSRGGSAGQARAMRPSAAAIAGGGRGGRQHLATGHHGRPWHERPVDRGRQRAHAAAHAPGGARPAKLSRPGRAGSGRQPRHARSSRPPLPLRRGSEFVSRVGRGRPPGPGIAVVQAGSPEPSASRRDRSEFGGDDQSRRRRGSPCGWAFCRPEGLLPGLRPACKTRTGATRCPSAS